MIEHVLRELNNYFVDSEGTIIAIEIDGFTSLNTFFVGQYVRIKDTKLNDGVYKIAMKDGDKYFTEEAMIPEPTIGYVYGLAIPRAVIHLASEIDNHVRGIKSEALGDYSVQYDDWRKTFRSELSTWRKVYQ